jgi:hypothetical protein
LTKEAIKGGRGQPRPPFFGLRWLYFSTLQEFGNDGTRGFAPQFVGAAIATAAPR